jgi:glycerol-3-phosphate acyltransferase PlsX
MRLGIDISGGDFAPRVNVLGAILAKKEIGNRAQIVLIGNREDALSILESEGVETSDFEIVHAPEVITMHDHPTRAIPSKPNSSISIGFQLLSEGKIDSFASTGNTGAMLVGALYKVNAIPGIIRPCITSLLPIQSGGNALILDVGANADCKPDVLYQFAVLGSLYAKYIFGINDPKVALLNIGEEETKGNLLTTAAYRVMQDAGDFNFVGNVEGRDIFTGKADVIVCDGFTGNVVLKQAEGMYAIMKQRDIKDEYFDRFNYENYGGTPILGINSDVIIGHGISNEIAVKNMILHACEVAESGLTQKIKQAFK